MGSKERKKRAPEKQSGESSGGSRPPSKKAKPVAKPESCEFSVPVKAPTKPKGNSGNADKTDWPFAEPLSRITQAADDWDNQTGHWKVGDNFQTFGAKYNVLRVMSS